MSPTQVPHDTPSPPSAADLTRLQDELLATQQELAHQLRRLSTDPTCEDDAWDAILALRSRRDATLDRWARTALSLLVRGGQLHVSFPDAPPASPQPQPDVATVEAPPASAPPEPVSSEACAEPGPEPSPPVIAELEEDDATQESAGPPPDPAALQALANAAFGPAWIRAEAAEVREDTDARGPSIDVELVQDLGQLLGPVPSVFSDVDAVQQEVRRLSEAAFDLLPHCVELPLPAQQAVVGLLATRCRTLQDDLPEPLRYKVDLDALDRVFSVLTRYSSDNQPGYVFGLKVDHRPTHGSWADDAVHWTEMLSDVVQVAVPINPERALNVLADLLDSPTAPDRDTFLDAVAHVLASEAKPDDPRLVRLTEPRLADLQNKAKFKKLRRAIKQARREDSASESELSKDTAIADSWPLKAAVAGRRAVIVGGDLRTEAHDRIQSAFGFATLEWVTTDHKRHYQSLAARIERGGVDMVILLRRFIGHDVDRIVVPVCKQADVPWVSVPRGYGVTAIQGAMEQYLAHMLT